MRAIRIVTTIAWGAKFAPAFEVEASGDLRVEVNKVGAIETVG